MQIKDNFLQLNELEHLQSVLLGCNFPWYYNHFIVHKDKNSDQDFQFVHTFYREDPIGFQDVHSSAFQILHPILQLLDVKALIRIKANLRSKIETPNIPVYHTDCNHESTTSIFYVNTNNGYTLFEDGEKVESVENRMITFPANTSHTGVSQTDEKSRVVINLNYF
tara:strand:- start:1437 stop:1934 length:498 start_codon:yes stop_codon:yes gene_type:complete